MGAFCQLSVTQQFKHALLMHQTRHDKGAAAWLGCFLAAQAAVMLQAVPCVSPSHAVLLMGADTGSLFARAKGFLFGPEYITITSDLGTPLLWQNTAARRSLPDTMPAANCITVQQP